MLRPARLPFGWVEPDARVTHVTGEGEAAPPAGQQASAEAEESIPAPDGDAPVADAAKAGEVQEVASNAEANVEEAAAAGTVGPPEADKPVTLGYKTFTNGQQGYDYFHLLLQKVTKNQNLNEVPLHIDLFA